jgi:hypothetical protein
MELATASSYFLKCIFVLLITETADISGAAWALDRCVIGIVFRSLGNLMKRKGWLHASTAHTAPRLPNDPVIRMLSEGTYSLTSGRMTVSTNTFSFYARNTFAAPTVRLAIHCIIPRDHGPHSAPFH